MRKRILRNKKGFTLIELIATVTLMAIIAGIAVPSIYYTTARRQKSAAENDSQSMYRNAISCISELEALYITPDSSNPVLRGEILNDQEVLSSGGWYVEYSKQLARRLYATIVALDIEILYYDPNLDRGESKNPKGQSWGLQVPSKRNATAAEKEANGGSFEHIELPMCTYSERSTLVTAGNKDPYIVVQVIRQVTGDLAVDENAYENYLIISYHNSKNQFVSTTTAGVGDNLSTSGAYTTNKDNPIIYTFHIRKSN